MSGNAVDPVIVATVETETEAALIIAALSDQGIEAQQTGALTSGFRAETPGGVRILVHQGDYDRALAAIEAYRNEVSDIDWSKVDVGQMEE